MQNSISAYKKTCKALGIKPATIKENIPIRDDATLVIVPNEIFTWAKIKKLAVEFGKGQPYKTWTYDKLYNLYTKEELSGEIRGKKAYRYLYIPKKFNVVADTIANQAKNNKGHVPSVLEAVCFWYALRENGDPLDFDSTYIRHFNLEPKAPDGWSGVPESFVRRGGEPLLNCADADFQREARVAVGSDLEPLYSPYSSDAKRESLTDYLLDKGHTVNKKLIDDVEDYYTKELS